MNSAEFSEWLKGFVEAAYEREMLKFRSVHLPDCNLSMAVEGAHRAMRQQTTKIHHILSVGISIHLSVAAINANDNESFHIHISQIALLFL